jgi:hypothetical protein
MRNQFMTLATSESPGDIEAEGGTGMWRVKPANVHNTDYVVICSRPGYSLVKDLLSIESYSAFMIGKVSGVMGMEGRYRIMINEVADLDIPKAWEKGTRFPFLYSLTPGLEDKINLETLDWRKVPAGSFA